MIVGSSSQHSRPTGTIPPASHRPEPPRDGYAVNMVMMLKVASTKPGEIIVARHSHLRRVFPYISVLLFPIYLKLDPLQCDSRVLDREMRRSREKKNTAQ